jgi:propionyl-CoA carboxylase alpha chain
VTEGSEISMFYDPMIAKLCTHAPDRISAVDAMADALDRFEVEGIGHNLPFLSALMQHPRWREGRLSTGFIAEEYPEGFGPVGPDAASLHRFAQAGVVLARIASERNAHISGAHFPVGNGNSADKVVRIGQISIPATISKLETGFGVSIEGGAVHQVETDWQPGRPLAVVTIEGRAFAFKVAPSPGGFRMRQRGMDLKVQVLSTRVAELAALMPEKAAPDTSNLLLCPMPGLITSVLVKEGDEVQEGQALAIVEAMKMENMLRAEKKAKVTKILAKTGASLAVDEVIMEFGS